MLRVQSPQAAALWRAQWLSGLQWHNAFRSGHPVRAGSSWQFVPLDPNDPIYEVGAGCWVFGAGWWVLGADWWALGDGC